VTSGGGARDFTAEGERTIYEGRVLHLVTAAFRSPDGEPFERDVVRSPGAVAIVPISDGPRGPRALVLRQFRPAVGEWLLEIPAGLRDKPGEPPETTAARELGEEAGLAAARYELVTVFVNAAGMTDQRTHSYLATGLREVPSAADGSEERYLVTEQLDLVDVPAMIAEGRISDAKTIIGLLLARDRR
jgi:8-oxo-dGTP pyrophosphatase MutT (NUDIX family)